MNKIRVIVSKRVTCKDGTKQNILFEKICEREESLVFPYAEVQKALFELYSDKDIYVTFETHNINYKNM